MKTMKMFSKQEITEGEYRGYQWLVADNGSHFCAYFYVPKGHKMYGYDFEWEEHDLMVHGGVTYCQTKPDYTVIGWDYAHFMLDEQNMTLEEVISDVTDAIDCFITLYDKPALTGKETVLDRVLKFFRKDA